MWATASFFFFICGKMGLTFETKISIIKNDEKKGESNVVADRTGKEVPCNTDGEAFLRFLYRNAAGRVLLKLFCSKPVSVLVGGFMNSRLSAFKVKKSLRTFDVDLSELETQKFPCYNAFFTRKKKKDCLHFDPDENVFCAPADSKLTVFPLTENGTFAVKGVPYDLSTLLGSEEDASAFCGGYAFVFRLSVDDYHRYSYFDDGKELSHRYIKGEFHTVNPIALEKLPVFHRNAREVTLLSTAHFGKAAFIEVGAMLVGKIVNDHRETFARGEEKGYFEFGGSTVVVLCGADKVLPDPDVLQNSKNDIETRVRLGERVGEKA